jgi:hypothetical protein
MTPLRACRLAVPAGNSIGAAWRPCADSCALAVQGDESIRWRVSRAARRGQASRAGGPCATRWSRFCHHGVD